MASQLSEAMSEITQHASQAITKAFSDVAHGGLDKFITEDQLKAATQKLGETVKSAPWQTMGIALLVGVVVGMSLKK